MKQGWELKRFEEILSVNQIGLIRNAKEQGQNLKYRYLKMDSISADNDLIEGKHVYVDASDEEVLKYSLDEGDFLFNTRNSYELVGKTCIYEPTLKEVTLFNNNIMRVKFKNGISSKFINYAFSSEFVKEKLEKLKSGTTSVVGIYFNGLKNLPIPIPPLPEQQNIVSILDNAFAAIAKAKANAEQNLKNAKKLFESYLFVGFENKDEGWEKKILKEVCELKSGTTISPSLERSEGDVLYTKVGDMNLPENKVEINTSTRFVNSKEIKINQIIPEGAIIFPKRGGAIATNKKRKIIKPTIVDLNTMAIIPSKKIDKDYFFHWFQLFDLNSISNGANIPQINNYSFDEVYIPFPTSLKAQQKIVQKLDALSAETKRLEAIYQQKINNLEELKKSILQKAFNGELKM